MRVFKDSEKAKDAERQATLPMTWPGKSDD